MTRGRTFAVAAITLALPTLASPARAALDALCGQTITTSITLSHDIDCTGHTGIAITVANSDVVIDGAGFRLLAPDSSRAISVTGGHSNVQIRNLEVVGWCTGVGIYIDGGTGHVIDQVVATGRSIGAEIRNTSDLTINALTADSASTTGLALTNVALPLSLTGLDLRNNYVGLRVNGFTGPYTIDANSIPEIRGSDTGILLEANVSNLTFDGLVLDGDSYGIQGSVASISRITLRNLDLSGRTGVGHGAYLWGDDHTVDGVTANRRDYGVRVLNAARLSVRHLDAAGARASALHLDTITQPLTLTALSLTDSLRGLVLHNFAAPAGWTLGAWDQGTDLGAVVTLAGNDTSIELVNVQNAIVRDLTLDGDAYAIHAFSTTNAALSFIELDLSGSRGAGHGLYLAGPNHLVQDVTANRRSRGMDANGTSALTVTDLTATGSSVGARIASLTNTQVAPALTRLTLTDNTTGLLLNAIASPMTLSPANLVNVAGSLTGLQIDGGSADITVRDLAFDNPAIGIYASGTRLTFERVDVSGDRRGEGFYLGGADHELIGVTANARVYGVHAYNTTGISITDLTAHHNTVGLWFRYLYAADAPPLLDGLDLRDNTAALELFWVKSPFTLGAAARLDTTGSTTGLRINYSSDLIFEDLILRNPYRAIEASIDNARLTFTNIDARGPAVSGTSNAYGITLVGPDHTLTEVDVSQRYAGVTVTAARGLRITDLTAAGCQTSGLVVGGVAAGETAPVFDGLDLRDNDLGLYLYSIHQPMSLDPSIGLDVRGSNIGIRILTSSDMVVKDLVLTDNPGMAIHSWYGNTRLTFDNLTLSGHGVGTGLHFGHATTPPVYHAGTDHIVRDVDVSHRQTGLTAFAASNLTITGLTATDSAIGLRLEGTTDPVTLVPPTLTNLTLSDNLSGLELHRISGTPGDPLVIDAYDDDSETGVIASLEGCRTGVSIGNVTDLRVTGFAIEASPYDTTATGIYVYNSTRITFDDLVLRNAGYGIHAYYGNSALTFEDLDLSGDGRGVGLRFGYLADNAPVYYGGPDHVIRDVVASHRVTGISAMATSNLVIDGLTANHNETGLTIEGYTNNPGYVFPTLSRLDLADNQTGISLYRVGGTASAKLQLGPTPFTSIARCETSIQIGAAFHLRLHDLTLDGSLYGVYASGSDLAFSGLTVSGFGSGTGLRVTGLNPVVEGVTAERRQTGVHFYSTTNPTLTATTAARNRNSGIHFELTTHPITASGLTLTDNVAGLRMATVTGAGSLAIGTGVIAAHSGNVTTITLSSASGVSVDTGPLGLTQSGGDYNAPVPSSDLLCGTTITTDLILSADLDCSGITTTAITIGRDGLTIDGGPSRHRIIAPRAAVVISSTNQDDLTIKRVDVSGAWAAGDGLLISGGDTIRIEGVVAHARSRGASISNTTNLSIAGFTADGTVSSALRLDNPGMPLSLSTISAQRGLGDGLTLSNFDGDDPIDGDFVFDASVLTTLAGHATSIALTSNVRNVAFAGPLAGLDGTLYGIRADANNHAGLTFSDLDASGRWAIGTGLLLHGDGHLVDGLTVHHRVFGVDLRNGAGLTLTDLDVSSVTAYGLTIDALSDLTLADLSVTRSSHGLVIRKIAAGANLPVFRPWSLLDPTGVVTSLDGCATGIHVADSAGLVFEDLTLPQPTYGLYLGSGTADLIVRDLDLGGRANTGTGLYAVGDRHLFERIDVANRATAFWLAGGSGHVVRDLDVDGAFTAALSIGSITPPLTLEDLTLERSAIGLSLTTVSFDPGSPLIIGPHAAGAGMIRSLAGSHAAIQLNDVDHVIVEDLVLPNRGIAVSAGYASNRGITLRRLNVSGARSLGGGINLAGNDHVIDDVTADIRGYGVSVSSGSNVAISRLRARGNSSYGLGFFTVSAPIALRDLTLSNNYVGLQLSTVHHSDTSPLAIGPFSTSTGLGAIRDIGGCDTAIQLADTRHLRLHDLELDAHVHDVHAYSTSNRGIRLEDLTLSPRTQGGIGIYLAGPEHVIDDVTCELRGNCINAGLVSGLAIRDLVARRGGTGLYLHSNTNTPATYAPLTLDGLDLKDNDTGLYVYNWSQPLLIDPTARLDVSDSRYGVQLQSVANLTFRNLTLTRNYERGVALSTGNAIVFDNVDVSGFGTGNGVDLTSVSDSVLERVTADRRVQGVYAYATSNVRFTDLKARNGGLGLYLHTNGGSRLPPTFDGLELTGNGVGLQLYAVSGPFTIDAASAFDVSGSRYGVYAQGLVDGMTFEGLNLDNPAFGFEGSATNLTFRGVDASATGRGRGFSLNGAGHRFESVTADFREYGVYLNNARGTVIDGLHVDGASSAGLYLHGVYVGETAPVLRDLHLTRGVRGFEGTNLRVPIILDQTVFSDLTGNYAQLHLSPGVSDVTVRGLTLPSPGVAIEAAYAYDARVTIEDTDVTGYCRGTGINTGGTDKTLKNVTAARRNVGIWIGDGDRARIEDSVIGANVTGISHVGNSMIVNTTVVANAANTTSYFQVVTQVYINVGMTLRVGLPTGPEDRVVSAVGGNFVTFTAPLSAIPAAGTTVRALDHGDPRLTIVASDICANGTGLNAGSRQATATENYWRAATGPRHASIPAGTGDLVTATNTSLTPFVEVPTDKDNPYCNQAPIADAGDDQEVCEGDLVTLDGSGSYDPDIEPLLYGWLQLDGSALTLDAADTAQATFTAPAPPSPDLTATLTFELTVDDRDIQRTDTTAVTITRRNPAPTAVAGADQDVAGGAPVSLTAAGSVDPDGTSLTYTWVQTSGPAVILTGANTPTPSFTAPEVAPGDEAVLVFTLTVSDEALPGYCGGASSGQDSVTVRATNVNEPPVADAGDDQTVGVSTPVTLDGRESHDPDDDPLTFSWIQIGGPSVTLVGADSAEPTFTTPALPCGQSAALTFRLTVSDGRDGEDDDEVTINVLSSDVDSDGDGVVDCADACPADPEKIAPGVCGCGAPDVDGDGDGTLDCVDGCPSDPDKSDPGVCGCDLPDTDTDGDGQPDCVDRCVDVPASSCTTAPFYVSVKTPSGPGQIACAFDGTALQCANVAGVALVTTTTQVTSCE